jgi:hypothetical protein
MIRPQQHFGDFVINLQGTTLNTTKSQLDRSVRYSSTLYHGNTVTKGDEADIYIGTGQNTSDLETSWVRFGLTRNTAIKSKAAALGNEPLGCLTLFLPFMPRSTQGAVRLKPGEFWLGKPLPQETSPTPETTPTNEPAPQKSTTRIKRRHVLMRLLGRT